MAPNNVPPQNLWQDWKIKVNPRVHPRGFLLYNERMKFTFEDFQLIPYTRMTQKALWTPRAQKYIKNQEALSWGYSLIMREKGWGMIPPHQDMYIRWEVTRSGSLYQCDFDNLIKALCDAAKGVVFEDDRYITLDLGGEKKRGIRPSVTVEFGLVTEVRPLHAYAALHAPSRAAMEREEYFLEPRNDQEASRVTIPRLQV